MLQGMALGCKPCTRSLWKGALPERPWHQLMPLCMCMGQGYYDGQIAQLTKRHQQRRRRRKGPDERAILTEQRLPEPGACTVKQSNALSYASCSDKASLIYRLINSNQ